jgi:hypothetical protein
MFLLKKWYHEAAFCAVAYLGRLWGVHIGRLWVVRLANVYYELSSHMDIITRSVTASPLNTRINGLCCACFAFNSCAVKIA